MALRKLVGNLKHQFSIFFEKKYNLSQFEVLREKCPYSELFWSVFSLNQTEYGEIGSISPYSVCIQSECGKKRTRKTPNTDTFHAVKALENLIYVQLV